MWQELIAEQFIRGQSDPELKKYLWVVIWTQTLIEVCTHTQGNSPGKLSVDRDLTHTGLHVLHSTPMSSSCITSTPTSHTPDTTIIPTKLHPISCTETCASTVVRNYEESQEVSSQDVEETNSLAHTDRVQDQSRMVTRPAGRSVDWSVTIDN